MKKMLADMLTLFGIYLFATPSWSLSDGVWVWVIRVIGGVMALYGLELMIHIEVSRRGRRGPGV